MDNLGRTEESPWVTFDYEKDMYQSLSSYFSPNRTELTLLSNSLRFAAVESLLLHTRIMADILLSRDSSQDAIRLTDLLPGFTPSKLNKLKEEYGSGSEFESPCWTLNKMLAHPTTLRLRSYDYTPIMKMLGPIIDSIITEIDEERVKRNSV